MSPAKGGGGRAVHCPRTRTAEATHLQGRRPCSTPRALEASFALPRNTHYHSCLHGIEVPDSGHFYSTYPPLSQQLTRQRRKATAKPTTYVAAPQGNRQRKKDGRRGRRRGRGAGDLSVIYNTLIQRVLRKATQAFFAVLVYAFYWLSDCCKSRHNGTRAGGSKESAVSGTYGRPRPYEREGPASAAQWEGRAVEDCEGFREQQTPCCRRAGRAESGRESGRREGRVKNEREGEIVKKIVSLRRINSQEI